MIESAVWAAPGVTEVVDNLRVAWTSAHGLLPAVVPQLKAITIGGAVAGLGIEASSFRYGLAHGTVDEMDVLLANGDVVTCTPQNEHRDLFFGLPNSFGTLGYAIRVKARLCCH